MNQWWNKPSPKGNQTGEGTYKVIRTGRNEENFEKYKLAMKEAKKVVNEAKSKAYENLWELKTKTREKYI